MSFDKREPGECFSQRKPRPSRPGGQPSKILLSADARRRSGTRPRTRRLIKSRRSGGNTPFLAVKRVAAGTCKFHGGRETRARYKSIPSFAREQFGVSRRPFADMNFPGREGNFAFSFRRRGGKARKFRRRGGTCVSDRVSRKSSQEPCSLTTRDREERNG